MATNQDSHQFQVTAIDDEISQTTRIHRLVLAFSGYLFIVLCIATPAHFLGFSRFTNTLEILYFLVLPFAVFYLFLLLLIFTGFNKRFRDPELIFVQQFVGVLVATIICYFAVDSIRGACLILYIHIFYFGTFHHRPRGFAVLVAGTVILYSFMIFLLNRFHPEAITVKTEIMRLIILLTALVWTAGMGNYLEMLRSKIRQLAIRDDLTGALNRRELFRMLAREKSLADRSGIPFSVCMLDLDNFKGINDTHGHQAGDQVLKSFARGVKAIIRAEDYLARYGGEEFVVVFANFQCRENNRLCVDRLREMTQELTFPELAASIRVTVSVGVSTYQSGDTIDALMARADEAMYEAKRQGKNRVEFRQRPDAA